MRKEFLLGLLGSTVICFVFFYKTIIFGLIPFPGDLLISEYNPWRAYSYNGYVPGSYPSKFQYFDTIRQLYPWKTFIIDSLKKGEIPLWNPYNFSGSPLLANSQSAVLYPLNILYLLIPQVSAWTLMVVFQPFLAGFFTYLYARQIGISKPGSFVSSICFAFSLFMSVFLEYTNMGHTILWLPLVLYAVEKSIKKRTFTSSILFITSLVFSFLAGHLQLYGFLLLFVVIYILRRISSLSNLPFFVILIAISIGISGAQLLPTLEHIKNSARSFQSYTFLVENLLIQSKQLVLFISPDFFGNPAAKNYLLPDSYPGNALYIGFIPFILAFFSAKSIKNPLVKFYIYGVGILLLLFVRSPLTEFLYSYNVPLISTGSPTNAIFLLSFSLSILSGFGLENWLKSKKREDIITVLVGVFILAFVWIVARISHTAFIQNSFVYTFILFGTFILLSIIKNVVGNQIRLLPIAIILVTSLDLFYFFTKFNPFVTKSLVFPNAKIFNFLLSKKGVDRFWGYGSGAIQSNFATQYSLFSPDGYDPLYPKRYGEFIQSSKTGHIESAFDNSSRSDAIIVPGYGEEDMALNINRQKILNVLGVKYILDRDNSASLQKFPSELFTKIYTEDGWQIYENKKSIPRISLFSDAKFFSSNAEFEKQFFAKYFDASKTLLLESKDKIVLDPNAQGTVELKSYTPNKVIAQVAVSRNQLLFLSDTFYPGWKAYIDGRESEVLRADYAFRAIVVPKGTHTVTFTYTPESFYLGVKTTIISTIVGFFVLVYIIRYKRHEH